MPSLVVFLRMLIDSAQLLCIWTLKRFTSGFSYIAVELIVVCSLKSLLLLLPTIMNSVFEVFTVRWRSEKGQINVLAICSFLTLLLSIEVSKVKLTVTSTYCQRVLPYHYRIDQTKADHVLLDLVYLYKALLRLICRLVV